MQDQSQIQPQFSLGKQKPDAGSVQICFCPELNCFWVQNKAQLPVYFKLRFVSSPGPIGPAQVRIRYPSYSYQRQMQSHTRNAQYRQSQLLMQGYTQVSVLLTTPSGPVAQWIRHRPSEPGIAGSSPARVIWVSISSLSPFQIAQALPLSSSSPS